MDRGRHFLAEWTARPPQPFCVEITGERPWAGGSMLEAELCSQRWQGVAWRHQLHVFRPPILKGAHGLLFLSGGASGAAATHVDEAARFRGETSLFCALARDTGTVVGVLSHLPAQPIFGLGENALIAHTFERFLDTGRRDWPILVPMVAAARRGMDAVQQVTGTRWALSVDTFTLAGISKRGWAAWLAAGVDRRVTAIAPVMMDFIDLPRQLDHQRTTWGRLPTQMAVFEASNLPERLTTPEGQALLDIVDPIRCCGLERVAHVIISASNDEYWPVDAVDLFADRIAGPSARVLLPNSRHGSLRLDPIVAAIGAAHRHAVGDAELPQLEPRTRVDGDTLTMSLAVDGVPAPFTLWVADSPSLDLREAEWRPVPSHDPGVASTRLPDDRVTMFFGQVRRAEDGGCGWTTALGRVDRRSGGALLRDLEPSSLIP